MAQRQSIARKSSARDTILSIRDLHVEYTAAGGTIHAVRGINLEIRRGERFSIASESGSGKSTFANIVLGLARPTAGAVFYRGNDIARQSRADFAQYRREVQAIFQDPYEIFNPVYTVDNLFSVVIKKFKLARSRDKAMALIEDALQAVNLPPGADPGQVSGRAQRRAAAAADGGARIPVGTQTDRGR